MPFPNRTSGNQLSEPDVTLDQLGNLEVKKLRKRTSGAESSTIEVEIAVGNEVRSIRGEARFDVDPDLGQVLRVHVADKPGDFELLIPKANWKGIFRLSSLAGCEYKVSLLNGLACSS